MGTYQMGEDPRFYFYPDDSGANKREISLGEPCTVLDAQPVFASDAAAAIGYQVYRKTFGSAMQVRIVHERFHDVGGHRARQLRTMLNHLARGGWVAFSHDHARTWASRCTTTPGNGDLSLVTANNLFTALAASAAIGQYDHFILQSPNPYSKREQVEASSWTLGTLTIALPADSAVAYDHVADTLVRWEGFFPRLVLPPGADISRALTDEYRNTWTLDLTLWTQPDLEHAAIAAG